MKPHALIVGLLLILPLLLAAPALALLEYGETAPGFELKDLDGQPVRLADFAGKIVVLKLSTTWCPTCSQQLQEISAVKPFLDEAGVVVLDVYLQDTEEMVREHHRSLPRPALYHALLDDGRVRDAYGVYLIPRLLIIDGQQKVRRDGSLMSAGDMSQVIRAIQDADKGQGQQG